MNFLDSTQQPPQSFVMKPKKIMKKMLMGVFVLLLLGSMAAAGYFYLQWSHYKNNPNKVSEDELQQTINAVGKLIVLPTDEQPTVATVTEPDKLKDQPFFKYAKAGDKVLFYNKAKKAFLYDPVANKLIDVSTIADSSNPQQPPPADGQQPNVSGSNTIINQGTK